MEKADRELDFHAFLQHMNRHYELLFQAHAEDRKRLEEVAKSLKEMTPRHRVASDG